MAENGSISRSQFVRLLLEFFASVDVLLADLMPGRFDEASILLIVMRATMDDWVKGTRIGPPAVVNGAIRPHRIAMSYHRSPETMRRYMQKLVEHGFLTAGEKGVSLSPCVTNSARLAEAFTVCHDLMVRLVEDCGASRPVRPQPAPAVDAAQIVSRALDVLILPLEAGMMNAREPLLSAIWCIVTVLNVRELTMNPALAARLSDGPVPDELRRPVTTGTIVRILRVPYATLRRKLGQLEAERMVVRRDRGWIVPAAAFDRQEVSVPLARTVGYAMRKVRELERLGMDAAGRDGHYRGGRRPLIE